MHKTKTYMTAHNHLWAKFSIFFMLFIAVMPFASHAQSRMNTSATGTYKDKNIYEILTGLEATYNVRFCSDPELLPWYKLDYSFRNKTLHEVLKSLLAKHTLTYVPFNDSLVAVCRLQDLNGAYLRGLKDRFINGTIELPEFLKPVERTITIGEAPLSKTADAKVRISGQINDDDTGESIAGANIMLNGSRVGQPTNALGQFRIDLPAGTSLLTIRYIGYRDTKLNLSAWMDGEMEIKLSPLPLGLGEVLIEGNRASNKTQNVQTAVEALAISTVKELPKLLGEADVVRSLSTLAGVSNVSDGATGFNVRGGNVDQNLTLQDDAPLFNTAHVLGLFSVYNPDVVQSVTLYKGHVPAKYGGRLASVLDVKLRDGDFNKFRGNIGLSLAAARGRFEGPIIKKRVSIIAAVRRSYSDWMLQFAPLAEGKNSSAWFYDGLVKVTARLTEKSSLSVSAYQSKDYFRYAQRYGYGWGNQIFNATLRQPLGSRAVSIVQVNSGRYNANYFEPSSVNNFNLTNGVDYRNAAWRVVLIPNARNEINTGVQWNRNMARPEVLRPKQDISTIIPQDVPKDKGEEYAAFVDDEFKLGTRWKLVLGARGVVYRHFGEKTVRIYKEGAPITNENIIDSLTYGKGQTISTAGGIEPRVSISFKLDEKRSLKISYNRMRQYIHQISNLAAPTPVDVWQVSNTYIAPQTGDQYDIGYSSEWKDRKWELSSDVFYKNIQNMPIFKNLPDLLLNPNIETQLLAGEGRTYGFEISGKKNKGNRWTGWLNYTYVRTFLRTPAGIETVNNGDWFPSDFDQPHQVNAYAKYAFNPSVTVGFNYTYRMGRPITVPNRVYSVGGIIVPDYTVRNNERIPSYRRLDFSLNADQNKSRISGAKFSFNISIYNVLGRNNPFSVYFEKLQGTYPKAYSLSVIGAAIPSIGMDVTF